MIDIDKKIDELVNNHSKLDLAQLVVERDFSIETLNELIEMMKCCENCKHYKPAVTVNETICNMCEDFENGCNNSEISPYNKWELSD